MTDHPASWLDDPTGRHDHRYWDGTRWTDHVADAGVAASDPYDGPADATPGAPAAHSGWAATTEPEPADPAEPAAADTDAGAPTSTFSVSGWGATPAATEPEPGPEPEPASPATPWGAPAATTPSAPTWGVPSSTPEPTPTPTASSVPTWGSPATTPVEDEVVEPATTSVGPSTTWDDPPDLTSPTSTWGTPIAPAPATPKPDSRKGLVLALALLAVVVVVVALVATRDDEGSGSDGESFARQLSSQIQDQTAITDEQADCIGEYVVDEVGASRLSGVRSLRDQSAPPELQEDLNEAVQQAFTECDVDQAALRTAPGGTTDGTATDIGAGAPPMTEEQYEDYYRNTLGLSEEDARCLAGHSAEAEEAGEIAQGDGISQFYQFVDECGIDAEELFNTIATANPSAGG